MENEQPSINLIESTDENRPISQPESESKSSTKGFLLDALETVAIALIIFFVIYTFVAQPHLVRGESMQPNYQDGES